MGWGEAAPLELDGPESWDAVRAALESLGAELARRAQQAAGRQAAVQKSVLLVLPSSQISPASSTPSPHTSVSPEMSRQLALQTLQEASP